MANARAHVVIEGRVQGVLFRHHTRETAVRLGLKGWVRNCVDGSVEAVFEGDREKVDQMIEWCQQGPSQARVTRVHQTWDEYGGEFKDFSITY